MSSKKILICISGATAIGKTAFAIEVAKCFNTEIISSDSRQFFREMTIGTAVPSKEELEIVPHHFIQHKSIFENYSIGRFEAEVISLLDVFFKTNDIAVMVGGSGLYTDAVTEGIHKFPEINIGVRESLNSLFEKKGITALQEKLKKLDPEYYDIVAKKNPRRLIRALEVCLSSEKIYSYFLNQPKSKRYFRVIHVAIDADRELIYRKINKRVDLMMEMGLEDEAYELFPNNNLNALNTVGYKELFQYFDGEISKEKAVEEIKKNTRRFAKRQLTWLNRKESILWVDYQIPLNDKLNLISSKI